MCERESERERDEERVEKDYRERWGERGKIVCERERERE